MNTSVAALAQESWREADLCLARACAECARAQRALTSGRYATETARPLHAAQEALALTMDELTSALRLRGLVLFGKIGSVARYDSAHHALELGKARVGAMVRVTAPGVTSLGRGVVLKGSVRLVKSRKLLGGP